MTVQPAEKCQSLIAARHYLPVVALTLVIGGEASAQAPISRAPSAIEHPVPYSLAQARSGGGGFFSSLFGFTQPRARRAPPRSSWDDMSGFFDEPAPRPVGTYRTLCVRLCDGYYWPMSFRATRSQFEQDQVRCESSCAAPAKLFVHRNPGGGVEYMYDLGGHAYSRLPNAFRYRTEYVASCRCKPEPWSEAAHTEYKRREIATKAEAKAKALAAAANPTVPADARSVQPHRTAVGRWRRRQQVYVPRYRPRRRRWWSGFE